ncbi:MAG: helix-turn-helix domain-containing protein [Chloroflexota bacterium]
MTTKKEILTETAKALTRNPNASLAELAQEIGIGRTTLHRHFPKRDDLLKELALYSMQLIDDVLEPLNTQPDLTAHDAILAMFKVLVPMGEHFHFLSLEFSVMKDEAITKEYQRQRDELKTLVQWAQDEGAIALDIPTVWVVHVIDSLIYSTWDAIESGDIARNEGAKLAFRTLMKGVGSK